MIEVSVVAFLFIIAITMLCVLAAVIFDIVLEIMRHIKLNKRK